MEFKASFNNDTIETLVAFANAKGGAVYVGLTDKGKVVGVQLGKESIQQWVNEIKSKTEPSIIPDVDFNNYITFYNPGKLYGDLSVEDLQTNTYQASAERSPYNFPGL